MMKVKKAKVAIIGGDSTITTLFSFYRQEYELLDTSHISPGSQPVALPEGQEPELILLNDLENYQHARMCWPAVPILIVSSTDNEQQRIQALDTGADDYIVKPFGTAEFFARLRAHLRRARQRNQPDPTDMEPLCSQDGALLVDKVRHQVHMHGQPVRLSPIEFKLLWLLMHHAGKVLPGRFLLQQIWGPEYGDEETYLRVYIHQLRHKIETIPSTPRYISTIPGTGYLFQAS